MLWVNLLWIAYFVAIIAMGEFSIYSTELYHHRSLSHRHVTFDKRLAIVFQTQVALMTGIQQWVFVIVHLIHHKKVDTKDDPLAPGNLGKYGKIIMLFFSVVFYLKAAKKYAAAIAKMRKNNPNNWVDDLQDRFKYGSGGLIALLLIFKLVGDPWLGVYFWLGHFAYYLLVFGYSSSYAHRGKYDEKNPSAGCAVNSQWVNMISCGAGFHRYHHENAGRVNQAGENEIDPGYKVIKWLEKLGLATVHE